jgi:cobalt-zinc-cadmium efflux system outer membrane protein
MRTDSRFWPALLALLAGCATVDARPAFDEMRGLVAQHAPDSELAWPEGPADDAALRERVQAWLAQPLTPDAAVRIALLNNRNLQVLYGELGVAQADLVQAGLLENPVLTADVRFGINGPGTGVDVGLVQNVISALQIPLKRRVAAAELERAKLEVAGLVIDLAARVKVSFVGLQGALQRLELDASVVEATALAADVARRQHTAGTITDFDLASEEALAAQAQVDLARDQARAAEDRERLSALMGLWGEDTGWQVGARLPDVPSDPLPNHGLESLAVAQRLDLAAARAATLAVAERLALERLYGLLPEGDLGLASAREIDDGRWSLGPSLGLPIPLFDQGQARRAKARAELLQGEARFAALAVEVRADVRRLLARAEAARTQAIQYRTRVLPLRRRVFTQAQLEYNGMLIGVFQLLQAKRDEVEAGRAYITALTDYWTTVARLEGAVGGALPTIMASAPASATPTSTPSPASHSPEGHHHGG